ncbi:MAG: LysR family transcriptional regulator [Gammaproteobacteria bacterium]|nr:LysR family transcriptional regulator [Gammaproteobacteria bacterium]
MEIANLKAFIAVAEQHSFSLAAEQLFITQPAISKRIKLLEQQLNTRLLDRSVKHITLTQAGVELLPRARKILQDMDECTQLIADLSGHTMGSLSLATSHHIGLHRLPPVLQKFVYNHPKVELDIHFMDSEDACHAVESGEMEIAIVTLPTKKWLNIKTKTIWTDELCIICNNQHPLTNVPAPTLEELLKYSAILPSKGTFTRNIIESALEKYKSPIKISLETNYLETIKMLVSVGLGWSILPKNMLSEDIAIINCSDFKASRALGYVINKNRTLSNPALAIIKLLKEIT